MPDIDGDSCICDAYGSFVDPDQPSCSRDSGGLFQGDSPDAEHLSSGRKSSPSGQRVHHQSDAPVEENGANDSISEKDSGII